jgi:hypothetical protein
MKPARQFGVLTAAAFALTTVVPLAAPASALADAPETTQSTPQKPASRAALRDLFTQQERDQFRERMRNAKTQEERQAIRAEWRGLAEARAQEKGISLPSPAARAARGDGPYSQLFSEEERREFREQMRAAGSREERQKLARAHRAVAEERANENGIALPERKLHRPAPPGNEPGAPSTPTPAN